MLKNVFRILIVLSFVIVFLFYSFLGSQMLRIKHFDGKIPADQPGSEWMSTDGNIKIYDIKSSYAIMSITHNNENRKYFVYFDLHEGGDEIGIYLPYTFYEKYYNQYQSEDFSFFKQREDEDIEFFDTVYKTASRFSVTVGGSEIFPEGEEIDFVRTKDGNLDSYYFNLTFRLILASPFFIMGLLHLVFMFCTLRILKKDDTSFKKAKNKPC